MKNLSRRQFIKTSAAGAAALTLAPSAQTLADNNFLGPVPLGNTGIDVTRLAMGTGTHGFRGRSDIKAVGLEKFIELAEHSYDNGIRLFDTADSYGTHDYVKEAIKHLPNDDVRILTKIWTRPNDWATFDTAEKTLDRFRKELGRDHLDIVLVHCQVDKDWPTMDINKHILEGLTKAKDKGIIGTHGVSCHSWEAMQTAAELDWVEVILSRINDNGRALDNDPETVVALLKKMKDQGKGVIGMKVFGGGRTVTEEQRESSLNFVWNSGVVDAITIGFTEKEYLDDALTRTKRILA